MPKRQKSLNGRVPLRRKGRKISSGSTMMANGDRNTKAPVPGEVYATHWKDSVYLVMVLPWSPSLAQSCPNMTRALFLQLIAADLPKRLIPECFSILDPSTLKWASGYEDGGEHVNECQYPVRWFDKKGFVGWVPGSELVGFDFLRTANKKKYKDLETPKESTQTFADTAAMQKWKRGQPFLEPLHPNFDEARLRDCCWRDSHSEIYLPPSSCFKRQRAVWNTEFPTHWRETPKGAFIIGQGGKCVHWCHRKRSSS